VNVELLGEQQMFVRPIVRGLYREGGVARRQPRPRTVGAPSDSARRRK
jgi:hypothetical protein